MQQAIDSFNPENLIVENPIENIEIDIDETVTIDVTDVFTVESGATITVTVEGSSDPDVATATIDGNTLSVTGIGGGIADITIKGATASDEEIDVFTVMVSDPNASNYWTGVINAVNNSGLGLQNNGAWTLGIALDLGTENFNIKKISYMCNDGTNAPLNWRVVDMNDATTWTDTELIGEQTLTNAPVIGTEWNDVDIDNDTELTGNVGLVVDLPAGGYFGRDETNSLGISYIYYQNTWSRLGEAGSPVAGFPGDWCLKAYVASTSDLTEVIPGSTELSQNYPNPFNPETTISFRNTMSGNVKLTVFNSNGELVEELINSDMGAGNHSVQFNALNLNAGVYFYTLTTPNATITKKMVLVK